MFSDSSVQDSSQAVPLEKPVILVVDDSAMMRRAVNRTLCDEFRVIEAKDGNEAWDIIGREHGIQVIFSDLMMPNKNGFQLLRDIRESIHSRINQLPVILLTGHEDDETMKRRAMALGATDFISKPFDPIQIEARAKSYAKQGDMMLKLEQTRQLLASQSTIDSLTGLGNSRHFTQHGPELLALVTRQGVGMSMLRLDVDKFGLLQNKTSRQVSDKIITNVAQTVRACVRREDPVSRIGTAKFGVLMPGASVEIARRIAERIQEQVNQTVFRLGETRFRLTMSGGLVCGATTDDFEALSEKTEGLASQAAKEGGGKLVVDDLSAEAAAVSEAGHPSVPTLGLDEAVALIREGQGDRVHPQIEPLLYALLPLLELGGSTLGLGIDELVDALRERLGSANAA
jgi:diguanylate cyclase (GGDEF)-like protein